MRSSMRGKIGRSRRSARSFNLLIAMPLLLSVIGCRADLYSKVQQREANEMLAVLLKKGVDASRVAAKDGTSTIQVEEMQLAFAIDLLNAEGLPRQPFKNLGEVFKGSGLIASPTEERARYVYALSEELSHTISDIDGVLSARVHVVLPKNDLLRQDAMPSSASVFIRHAADANVSVLLPQIKMLVANSIEGLAYDKISVVFVSVERAAVEQRPVPATGAIQAAKSIASMLVVGIGGAGAAFGVLCYVLLGPLVRQRRQSSREQPKVGARPRVPEIQTTVKKKVSDEA